MSINKDLTKYKESPEFKELLTKSINKIENIEAKIEAIYNEWEQINELTKNEFDVQSGWVKDLTFIIESITGDKGKDLKEYYEGRLRNARLFLFQAVNKYGQSNSILRYTDLDMFRFERANLMWIDKDIQGLIWIEETVKTEDDWAF